MGSASSKFRKHLQSGDEVQALQLYFNNSELRKALDPNCSYGDSHQHETPLHLAAKHGMHKLLRIFLSSKGGNPNKTNAKKETCLHCVCMEENFQSIHVCKRRAECLNELLRWRGATLAEGQIEKIDLGAKDEKLNTALHYAAASGLEQCVETLIQHGAPLFVENEENLTPCDTAERSGHARIALLLESKMVFSNDEETLEDMDSVSPVDEYSGLRPQDLQEAKDQLLVETADMLSVPLFTAEALLRNHEWSRETLLEAWMTDAVACCEKCGVTPPVSLFSEEPHVQEDLASPLPSPLHSAPSPLDAECHICANTFLIADEPVHMSCTHQFCKDCWEKYLNVKIQEGDAHHITCPAYDCTMLVPVDIIERIVSRDMALRYLQFDIKAFVDSNPDMKWCPFAGCGRAVKLPDLELGLIHGNKRNKIPSDTSRGVDCGVGHYFCWECLEESHEPCSCDNWSKWHQKISQIRPETLDGTEQETELAANCLWLVTNSKPCPNCKSPIQKNEGCNHMKCSKCKYDFCWVCLEQWKRHNSSTGGYFKCNRFEVLKKVEEQSAQLVSEAETKNKSMQELSRFVHYYTRFKNHENSYKLEEPLLKTAKDKMMKLAEAVTDSATAQTETKFVEDAVNQLLKARRVLKCSYVYGFYLDGPGYKKIVFEFMQTELEECTEILSQMVNRLYLRTPRRKIIEQANITQRKRLEFIMAISKGLVPPETPPSARRGKKKRKMSGVGPEDEDLHRAIVASIQEVNPANPWIKDASGRHTNVATLLEWPWPSDESEDSDGEPEKRAMRESIGKCRRAGCNKVRAKNPKTNGHHDHCSQYCLLGDRDDQETEEGLTEIVLDEHMELLRALEMSRLQYLRDSGLLHVPDPQDTQKSNQSKSTQTRVHRPRSNSAGQASKGKKMSSDMTSLEELGMEMQGFQDLESAFPTDAADSQKSTTQPHRRRKMGQSSRFDESKSTIVTRVPNKSVEDLYLLDQKSSKLSQRLFHGMSRSTSSSVLDHSHLTTALSMEALTPSPKAGERVSSCSSSSSSANKVTFGSMFGAIKDISVSNIHSSERDKTKDFLSKDLASIFVAWDTEDHCCRPDLIPSCSVDKLVSGDSGRTSGKSSKGKTLSKCKQSNQTSNTRDYRLDWQPTASSCHIEDTRENRSDCSDSDYENFTDLSEQDPHSFVEHGKTSLSRKAGHAGRAAESREISLLEMAENLVQMTADVHSRLKEVEKSFHEFDLSGRSEGLPPESNAFPLLKGSMDKIGAGLERHDVTVHRGDTGAESQDCCLEESSEQTMCLPLPKSAWSLGDCSQEAPLKKGKKSSSHKTRVYSSEVTRRKADHKGKSKKLKPAPVALMCDTDGHIHEVTMTGKDKLSSSQVLTVTSTECSYEKNPGAPPQSHSCNDMSSLSKINAPNVSDLTLTVPLSAHPGSRSMSRSDDLIEYSLIRVVPRNDTTSGKGSKSCGVESDPLDPCDKWLDASPVPLSGVDTCAEPAPGQPDEYDSDEIDYSVYV